MAFLRPIADVSDGGWTTESGGTSLFAAIDEVTQNDADYLKSSENPVDDVFELDIGAPTAVLSSGVVRFALGKGNNNSTVVDMKVELLQNSVVKAAWTYLDVAYGFTLKTETLSAPELASIATSPNLRLRVTANPSGGAALDITLTSALDSRITLTRASSGTRFNLSGVLATETTDAARFDHTIAGATRGLLLEGQRSNAILRSGALDHADWTLYSNGGTVPVATANAGTAPDGTTTATKFDINRPLGSTSSQIHQFFTATAVPYTATLFVKAATGGDVGKVISLVLYDGSVQTVTLHTLTADWVRIPRTMTLVATSCIVAFGYVSADGADTGACSFLAWGADVGIGSFADSYIATGASAVTRSADIASMTGTDFSNWYNQPEGTFVVEFDTLGVVGTLPILSLDDDTTNEQIRLYTSGTDLKLTVTDGGAIQADITIGTVAANTAYKVAFSVDTNDFKGSLAGAAAVTDASGTVPTVDRLRIGTDKAGNAGFMHIKSLKFYASVEDVVALSA